MSSETEDCWVLAEAEAPYAIRAASITWYATWGLTPEQVVGKSAKVLNGPGCDEAASKALMREFVARGSATRACVNVRSDGQPVAHTVSMVHAHGGILAISTDIDAPRGGDERAQTVEVVADHSSGGGTLRIVRASPAFLAFSGFDEAEVIGRSLSILHGPATEAAEVQRMQDAVEELLHASPAADATRRLALTLYTKHGVCFVNHVALTAGAEGQVVVCTERAEVLTCRNPTRLRRPLRARDAASTATPSLVSLCDTSGPCDTSGLAGPAKLRRAYAPSRPADVGGGDEQQAAHLGEAVPVKGAAAKATPRQVSHDCVITELVDVLDEVRGDVEPYS